MRKIRPGHKSMSRYAWIAPLLVLLAASLIYLFGNDASDSVEMLEENQRHERLRVGEPAGAETLQSLAALADSKRQRVLQNLAEFRAENRVLGPEVTVSDRPGSPGSTALAQRIGGLLAQYDLGRYTTKPIADEAVNDSGTQDDLILSVRGADSVLAYRLTTALSPMLSGTVRIRFDNTLKGGQLLMTVAATPGFTSQGVAVFPPRG
ncbi:MAG: hypothetical protein ABR578_05830 [Chromatocurvus sp.]